MRCEDYPCCGHESGECPVVDENGAERFRCVKCWDLMPPKQTSAVCRPCYYGSTSEFDDIESDPGD